MHTKSVISIIIPVYNTELFLRECLDSVINQTFNNIEIICVNDSSPDNSQTILEEYAKLDDRIIIVNRPNGGRSSARNSGLKLATGEYILFLDSDDTYRNDTCELSLNAILHNNVDMVCFGTDIVGDKWESDDFYYGIRHIGNIILNDDILTDVNASVCNKLFKHSLIKKYEIHFPEGLVYEDAAFYFKYTACCEKVFFIRDKLLVYKRGHSSSIMTQTKQGTIKAIDHLYIAKDIYDFWLKNEFIASKQTIMTQMFIDFFNFSLRFVPKDDRAKVLTVAKNLLLGMPEIIIPLSKKLFAERFNDLITRLKLDFIETTKLSECDRELLTNVIINSLINQYYGLNDLGDSCQRKNLSRVKKLNDYIVAYGIIATLRKISQKTKVLIRRYI